MIKAPYQLSMAMRCLSTVITYDFDAGVGSSQVPGIQEELHLKRNRSTKHTPPHFSGSRIQAQYSAFGFPRNASEYFVGLLATVAAITYQELEVMKGQ